MKGYIDLHSHWVAGIDDGAQTPEQGAALLEALRKAGFDLVVATPHMRVGMFENSRDHILQAFARTTRDVGASTTAATATMPRVDVASEHYLDDVVYRRLVGKECVPYPGSRSVLVELPVQTFPARLADRLSDIRRAGLIPVIAHPERYEPVWKDIGVLEPLIDVGAVLLLDVAALDGKYGRAPRKAAEALVDEGFYQAACSDAHRASDVAEVRAGIDLLFKRAGAEEGTFLLRDGPLGILEGRIEN